MGTNETKRMPEPSLSELQDQVLDVFWHAGATTGSMARDCKHGKTFFLDPDNYVALDGDAHFTAMLGMEWCWDCEQCSKEAYKYQQFLWANRFTISKFFNERLAAEVKRTAEELKQCTTTPK